MTYRTTGTRAAFFLFALLSAARAQAPPQTSTQTPPSDTDSYSLRQSAAAGDAKAQFVLADYYFHARYVTLEYAQALGWCRKSAAQAFAPAQNQLAACMKIASVCRRTTSAP